MFSFLMIESTDRQSIVKALLAAFSPFGSLTEGVNGSSLALAMVKAVVLSSKSEGRKAALSQVAWILATTTTEHSSTFTWGDRMACLCTPTSGTKIELSRTDGRYRVRVDFGNVGSMGRALQILAAAEITGVHFDAYRKYVDGSSAAIKRSVVVRMLRLAAKSQFCSWQDIVADWKAPEAADLRIGSEVKRVAFFTALS